MKSTGEARCVALSGTIFDDEIEGIEAKVLNLLQLKMVIIDQTPIYHFNEQVQQSDIVSKLLRHERPVVIFIDEDEFE